MTFSIIFRTYRPLLALLLLCFSPGSQAIDMTATEDAVVMEPQTYRLESWMKHHRGGHNEVWMVPVFGVMDKVELGVGGATQRAEASGDRANGGMLQLKLGIKPVAPDSWGAALVLGAVRNPGMEPGSDGGWNSYIALPVTYQFMGDRLSTTLMLEAYHDQQIRETQAVATVAANFRLNERFNVMAEFATQQHYRPTPLVGVQYWILPDQVQMDMAYRQTGFSGDTDKVISVGLRFMLSNFLK